MGFKTINNDSGSLKVGTSAGTHQFKVGDRLRILGESKNREVTFVMGKGEKTHLCMKNQGIVPQGEVEYELLGALEVQATEPDEEVEETE